MGVMRVVMATGMMDAPHIAAILEVGILIFY